MQPFTIDLNEELMDTGGTHILGWCEESIPSPPMVDSYSPLAIQSMPSAQSGGTSSSRGFKRKVPMVDVIDA